MSAQTALSWFLRIWRRMGGDVGEMVDAMALFLVEVRRELRRKHVE